MNKLFIIICFLSAIALTFVDFPEGAIAALLTTVCSALVIYVIRRQVDEDVEFLTQVFLIALLVRMLFGIILHIFVLRSFFAGDAYTYDALGYRLIEIWSGLASPNDEWSQQALNMPSGWGMNYLVSFIYLITGRSMFAAQSFCAVIGAATAPLIYKCASEIYANRRVGKISALLVALYPAFIVWTGQLLKDGIIIFLLVLTITIVLQLQRKFSYLKIAMLGISLLGILSLRFYIFYMVSAAVVGSFIIGLRGSSSAIFRRIVILAIIGLGLTYIGVLRRAGGNIDEFANLDRIQNSRNWAATSSESGFAKDADVSTTEGAILFLPVGFIYLMLAPFPWQATNLRQALTMPEILLWWASMPLLVIGLWYTIKYRLRASMAVLIFTLMLTLAYSVFQGNVGTAYRQRTQIQVFLFIFIAVGWTVLRERVENRKALRTALRQRQQVLSR